MTGVREKASSSPQTPYHQSQTPVIASYLQPPTSVPRQLRLISSLTPRSSRDPPGTDTLMTVRSDRPSPGEQRPMLLRAILLPYKPLQMSDHPMSQERDCRTLAPSLTRTFSPWAQSVRKTTLRGSGLSLGVRVGDVLGGHFRTQYHSLKARSWLVYTYEKLEVLRMLPTS